MLKQPDCGSFGQMIVQAWVVVVCGRVCWLLCAGLEGRLLREVSRSSVWCGCAGGPDDKMVDAER
jgi:hypothetical protein